MRLKDGEYKLLHTLSLDAGGATTYQSLRRRVWETRGGSNPRHILNERGLGCRTPGPEDALGRKRAGFTAESPHRIRSPAAPHGVRSSSSVVVSPCVVCTPFNSDFWYTEADVGLQVPPVSWLYYNGLGFPSRTDGLVRTTQYANECH